MEKRFNIVLVGGGSTWTPGILKAICKKQKDFPLASIVLYDVDGERQEVIGFGITIVRPFTLSRYYGLC